jgi:hypothetical protein
MMLQTEFDFVLPLGYNDGSSQVQRVGQMRLAIALDEIESLKDPRVQANEAYLPVVLLSRVVTRLGELPQISTQVIESLFAADLAYLEDLYMRLNSPEQVVVSAVCPHCSNQFRLQVAPLSQAA